MGVPYAEVIGDPVAHSKSPLIHTYWLEQLGAMGEYRRTKVTEAGLDNYFRERRQDPHWRGCNVTMPLKRAAIAYLDDLHPTVERVGAVNCVVTREGRLTGLNFDAEALLRTLRPLHQSGTAVLIGSGGAARAALWALSRLGLDRIVVTSRDPAKAAAMAAEVGVEVKTAILGRAPECALLLNATPLGMESFPPLPISLGAMPADGTVFDMVYNPLETPLLVEARARGLRAIDGLTMLIEQASLAFAAFFGAQVAEGQRVQVREVLLA